MITIDKALLGADGSPSGTLLGLLLDIHQGNCRHWESLKKIYSRDHDIKSRNRLKGLPNNKLAHDLPRYIVTMSSGYLVGNPVQYAPPKGQENEFAPLADALKAANSDSVDAELAVNAAIYGKGVEICYADAASRPRMAQVSPLTAFVVYDDTVENNPLLGITIMEKLDAQLKHKGDRITVYTANKALMYERTGQEIPHLTGETHHKFGAVPLIEYWNNDEEQGDFEPVIDLINAYDALQSDRMNDKQQFTDSILVLKGLSQLIADDTEEYEQVPGEENLQEVPAEKKEKLTPAQRLRQSRMLFLSGEDMDATYLTKPAVESDTEILRQALKEDIHKLSMVPDLTDENFAGNVSGVAMRFKLLGLENLTRIKERWFREGLQSRLRLFAAFLGSLNQKSIDVDSIQITFKHSLPVNELEIAQTLQAYDGLVPKQLLVGQVPFVEDAEEAVKMMEAEKAESVRQQQERLALQPFRQNNQRPDGEDDEA